MQKMKACIRLNCPQFNTARMVRDYAQKAYFSTSDSYLSLSQDNYAAAKELAHWKRNLFEHWYDMRVKAVDVSGDAEVKVSQVVQVKAEIDLAGLKPEDVQVQLYQGPVDEAGEFIKGRSTPMHYQGESDSGCSLYLGETTYHSSGLQGLSLRILPQQAHLVNPYEPRLVLWA
jgi:starch phosphorylase